MTTYSLWDGSTGRLIGSFADEALALAVIRSLNADGPVNETLALVREDEQGHLLTLAVGPALAEQAEQAACSSSLLSLPAETRTLVKPGTG